MEAGVDSNILFRTLISGGEIIDLFFNDKLRLYAPQKLKDEFFKNKEEILSKSGLYEAEFEKTVELLFNRIKIVPLEEYKSFIPKAKQLLGKHEKDEDFVALCLAKNIPLWTYESLLFDIGIAISTKQISEQLSKDS